MVVALLLGGALFPWPSMAQTGSVADPSAHPIRRLRLEAGVGYDFFSHRYTVLGADTSTTLNERSTYIDLTYLPLQHHQGNLRMGNRFYAGTRYLYNVLSLNGHAGRATGNLISTDLRWETKRFTNSDLLYTSDHDVLLGGLRGSWRGPATLRVTGRLRGEHYRYDQPNTFLYDSRRLEGGLALRAGNWWGPWGEIEGSFGRQAVPDSTVLDNDRIRMATAVGWVFASAAEVELRLLTEERRHRRPGPRPDHTTHGIETRGRLSPLARWGLWWQGGWERRRYSKQTLIYNNGEQVRIAAGPSWRPGTGTWDLRAGAGLRTHRSAAFTDTTYLDLFGITRLVDSYDQPFLMLEASLFEAGGGWLLATLESGWRRYDQQTDWDSPFVYLDLSATAEWPIGSGWALRMLVNISPERHREPEDNSTTNFSSVDLIWRFR